LNTDFERPVQIEVTVQEALTGRRQNTSATIPLHKNKYKMELVNTSPYYKPGLKFATFVSFFNETALMPLFIFNFFVH
jgi:CD109 antigen